MISVQWQSLFSSIKRFHWTKPFDPKTRAFFLLHLQQGPHVGGEEPRRPPIHTHTHTRTHPITSIGLRNGNEQRMQSDRNTQLAFSPIRVRCGGWRSRSMQLFKSIIPMLARPVRRSAKLCECANASCLSNQTLCMCTRFVFRQLDSLRGFS